MGNRGRAAVDVVKRKKKKGRPSLLDLQKRSLRLQSQQQKQDNRSPNPNPRLQFAQTTPSSSRRATRRNPNPPHDDPPPPDPEPDEEDEDEEEDGSSGGKRKEKKLKLVLRLPSNSDGEDPKRRKIDRGDHGEKAERNNFPKATDSVPGVQAGLGPTTPLPDQKLLVFILDRLQKKDTYGVFSESVDPEELPDYHEVIEHPMDFGTVRRKLFNGEYANLEQFENDIFLISSNAMRYNAPDTIYFRQARSIHELAKKNFENLRQESDDNEPEPKTVVKRGRPPNKNKNVGRPPTNRAASDFSSNATLANAVDTIHLSNLPNDLSINGSSGDKLSAAEASNRASYVLRCADTCGWISQQKVDRDEEHSGTALKGISAKFGKKITGVDENRRNTYNPSSLSTSAHDSPIFTTFNGDKKHLVPVGLHLEYAYARSLARFAAKLGPIGWVVAAKKIQTVLPPGTKFGRGWVIDNGTAQNSQPPPVITSTHPVAKSTVPRCTGSKSDKSSLGQVDILHNDSVVDEEHSNRYAVDASTSVVPINQPSSSENSLHSKASNPENGSNTLVSSAAASDTIRFKTPHQIHQNPIIDGFNSSHNVNYVSQFGKMIRPAAGRQPGPFGSGAQMAHAQAVDISSRANSNNLIHHYAGRPTLVENLGTLSSCSTKTDSSNDSKLGSWQGTTLQPKLDSVPPDLNVGFQSPGSPASGVKVDQQQPDLALQL